MFILTCWKVWYMVGWHYDMITVDRKKNKTMIYNEDKAIILMCVHTYQLKIVMNGKLTL